MGILQFFQAILTLNGDLDWGTVPKYLFDSRIIEGAKVTVILAIISQLVGSIIGFFLYIFRRMRNPIARFVAETYIWFFRGTPLLVQILILFGLISEVHLVRSIRAVDFFANLGFPDVALTAFLPAFIALSLNEGAYMAEIVRAGIDSIDIGQMEAAKSLGMTYGLAMRRIIVPQALRVILPPLGNEFNNMLKTTSLATVIGLYELYRASNEIGFNTFKILELGIVASIWYLGMTTIWGAVQSTLERRFNASNLDDNQRGTLLGRIFGGRSTTTAAEVLIESAAR